MAVTTVLISCHPCSMYVNPMVAVILGVVWAGEHITIIGILAMFVILTGVGLVSLVRGGSKG